ncbi:hypothetical protein GCM10028895_52670 [Pontibacter rugosus]
MLAETFDHEKALHTLLYVVQQLGTPDYHKAFRTLYFAERKCLATYGNTIVGDGFIKMEAGPVPTEIYDLVKIADGRNNDKRLSEEYINSVKKQLGAVKPYNLKALADPDMDFFAETEKECLHCAIEFCRHWSYSELKEVSHDMAWGAASMSGVMDTLKIAAAGGADEDAIKYLEESISNSHYYSL